MAKINNYFGTACTIYTLTIFIDRESNNGSWTDTDVLEFHFTGYDGLKSVMYWVNKDHISHRNKYYRDFVRKAMVTKTTVFGAGYSKY